MYDCSLRNLIFSSLITNKEHCCAWIPSATLSQCSCLTWKVNSLVLIMEESSGASIFVFVTRATTEQFINWLLVLVRITPRVADASKGKNNQKKKNILGTWADGWMLLKRPQSPHREAPDWAWTYRCLKVDSSPALVHVTHATFLPQK